MRKSVHESRRLVRGAHNPALEPVPITTEHREQLSTLAARFMQEHFFTRRKNKPMVERLAGTLVGQVALFQDKQDSSHQLIEFASNDGTYVGQIPIKAGPIDQSPELDWIRIDTLGFFQSVNMKGHSMQELKLPASQWLFFHVLQKVEREIDGLEELRNSQNEIASKRAASFLYMRDAANQRQAKMLAEAAMMVGIDLRDLGRIASRFLEQPGVEGLRRGGLQGAVSSQDRYGLKVKFLPGQLLTWARLVRDHSDDWRVQALTLRLAKFAVPTIHRILRDRHPELTRSQIREFLRDYLERGQAHWLKRILVVEASAR